MLGSAARRAPAGRRRHSQSSAAAPFTRGAPSAAPAAACRWPGHRWRRRSARFGEKVIAERKPGTGWLSPLLDGHGDTSPTCSWPRRVLAAARSAIVVDRRVLSRLLGCNRVCSRKGDCATARVVLGLGDERRKHSTAATAHLSPMARPCIDHVQQALFTHFTVYRASSANGPLPLRPALFLSSFAFCTPLALPPV